MPSNLAGVAQWVECQPANQKVANLIPGHGRCLSCGPGPQLGACERQLIDVFLHIDVSLPFPSSLPLSVKNK